MEPIVSIKGLCKSYVVDGEVLEVLKDIDLEIRQGEFLVIVGHSGCGKSTLLKIIAGLETPQKGKVTMHGAPITGPARDRGMIFQEHRLFPWLTIEKNLAIGLNGMRKKDKELEIKKYLELVQLSGFERAYPAQLSGGMSQRAAIARGLITQPAILLLDEPFGSLDALTKLSLQEEIKCIYQRWRTTMIMVTHDIEEAVYLADRIVVLSKRPGRISDVIEVSLGERRDRGSSAFAAHKKRVYEHFK